MKLTTFIISAVVAAVVFTGAQTRTATSPATHNNRGVALMTQQNFETALTEFKAAGNLLNQGIALFASGKLDDAEKVLQQVASKDQDNSRAHYNLALVYRSQGKLDDALRQFEEVRRMDPNDAHACYFLATIQLQRADYTTAAENFLKTIDLDPAFTSAYFGASRAYTALQQPDRARIYQDRFQAMTQGSGLNATVGNQYGEQGPYALAEESDVLSSAPSTNITVRFAFANAAYAIKAEGGAACLLDFDHDGLMDLFIGDSIYRNRGRLNPQYQKTATLQKALGCAVGDYDNDDYPDLFITTTSGSVLYHNNKGQFVPLTNGPTEAASAAAFVDLDHDGWLDLVAGDVAFRNKADGTFSRVSLPPSPAPLSTIIPTDHDNDRDIDLFIAGPGAPPAILSNNRDGTFTRKEIANGAANGATCAVVFDFNKDGWMDVFLCRPGQPPLLLRNSETQRFTAVDLPSLQNVRAYRDAAVIDFDNDGFMDLIYLVWDGSSYTLRLLRNMGSERFEDVTERTGLNRIFLQDAAKMLVLDIDDDGDSDVLITQNVGAPVVLQNDGGNRNGFLKLTLRGFKDNKLAIGTKVEIHGDGIRQKIEIATAGPVLFGTGKSPADFVRMLWPTGVVQDEIPGPRVRVSYTELDRKGSSCPTLYTWDGKQYRFITDVIGPGVIGEWESPGHWNASDTDEYARLDPGALAVVDGQYRLKVLSQMEEVTYLDALQLIAVDTPASVDVYPNDRYQPVPPYPEFKLWQVRDAHSPASVRDGDGRDLSKEVAAIDGVYAPVPKIPNYPGFARLHSIVIDLGDISPSGNAQLILRGFTEYFDSTTAHSAYYSGIEPVAPYLEVADGKGGWIRKSDSIGLPAGLPKTIVVDLTGMFSSTDHRVRVTDSMEIYWDQILVNTHEAGSDIRTTRLAAARATLGFAGYPLELSKRPEDYDYARKASRDAFQFHRGNYTRYGDVTPLMKGADDMFAVMASGDEVTAEFDAGQLPPLPDGWHRTFLVYADGFEKAMETYTPFPETVDPLPFHAMSRFPYPASEHYPDDPEHVRYQLEFNTRHIKSIAPARAQYRRP